MKPGTRRARVVVIAATVAAALLYLALRGIEWGRVWVLISSARPHWLALSCAVAVLSYFFRSLRWRTLLNAHGRLGVMEVFFP